MVTNSSMRRPRFFTAAPPIAVLSIAAAPLAGLAVAALPVAALPVAALSTSALSTIAAAPLMLVGCGDKSADPPATTSGPSSSARYAPTTSPSVDAPDAGGSGAEEHVSPYAGTYAGKLTSKRGDVTVPEGVPYSSWKDDPGGFEGENEIRVEVANDGLVTGTLTGALGKLRVSGLVDDDGFSLGVSPENEEADGMTGVCSGAHKNDATAKSDGALRCILRVSNATGSIVRSAEIALKKAPASP